MKTPYRPAPIPDDALDWPALIPRIGMAQAAVARFDGILNAMPNPELLLSPLTTQEAVLSSRIEGTHATLEQVLQYDAAPRVDTENKDDIREVQNYRAAMSPAVAWVKKTGLTLAAICHTHKVLMQGVRGRDKAPGRIRTTQNYIAHRGDPIDKAIFIPPAPEALTAGLMALEGFMAAPFRDPIVQTALVHAQFERLHPFLDGNGRVGRILIPLMLFSKGLISAPTFYISEYFEDHRDAYYDGLDAISNQNDWQGWCEFFLAAATRQAELNALRAGAILKLYNAMKDEINAVTRSRFALQTLDALFARPLLTAPDFVQRTGLARRTAFRIVDDLLKCGILKVHEKGAGRRPTVLAFSKLVKITEQKKFRAP